MVGGGGKGVIQIRVTFVSYLMNESLSPFIGLSRCLLCHLFLSPRSQASYVEYSFLVTVSGLFLSSSERNKVSTLFTCRGFLGVQTLVVVTNPFLGVKWSRLCPRSNLEDFGVSDTGG